MTANPRLTDSSIEIIIALGSERVEEMRQARLDRRPIYLFLIEAANVEVTWANG